MRFPLCAAFSIILLSATARAQGAGVVTSSGVGAISAQPREGFLRVFLDCPALECDESFFKTEVRFVDFVRAREDADVHVLVTIQTTGSGGREFTLAFLGRGAFLGVDDSLKYVSAADASDDDIRTGLVHVFEAGLLRYVAHTPAVKDLSFEFAAPEATAGAPKRDPWDSWTFRLSSNGSFQGQKSTLYRNLFASGSANRTTEEWKFSFSASDSYGENRYRFEGPPVTNYVSISRSTSGYTELVRSLGKKWSIAADASVTSSTYANERLALTAFGGIEYDIFPYSQSTRRLLTVRYQIGEGYQDYLGETIYGRTWEYQPSELISATAQVTQPWGTVSVDLGGSHYFLKKGNRLDLSKNSAYGDVSLDLKLFKGLSLTLFASGSLLHDQIFLPREGATEAEILLQRKQLETSFTYASSIGLSYTFGSIYSSVVNPRFGGGSGASTVFFF